MGVCATGQGLRPGVRKVLRHVGRRLPDLSRVLPGGELQYGALRRAPGDVGAVIGMPLAWLLRLAQARIGHLKATRGCGGGALRQYGVLRDRPRAHSGAMAHHASVVWRALRETLGHLPHWTGDTNNAATAAA